MTDVTCVLDAQAELGEGAVWCERERLLYWVDILAGRLHRFDPETGDDRTFDVGEEIGCVALRQDGGVVAALRSGFHFIDLETGAKTPIHDPEAHRPGNRFNDGTTDSCGRFWAGTMAMTPREPVGSVYRLDPDGSCGKMFDGLFVPNGMAFSPDGRRLYFADTNVDVQTIWVCDYESDTGTATNRRIFATTFDLAGRPDGGTIDAEGCYWMAGVGGWQLVRFTPAGKVDRIIAMPVQKPTKIAFGGPRLDVMYVTSIGGASRQDPRQPQAGGLFALSVGVSGLPAWRYAG